MAPPKRRRGTTRPLPLPPTKHSLLPWTLRKIFWDLDLSCRGDLSGEGDEDIKDRLVLRDCLVEEASVIAGTVALVVLLLSQLYLTSLGYSASQESPVSPVSQSNISQKDNLHQEDNLYSKDEASFDPMNDSWWSWRVFLIILRYVFSNDMLNYWLAPFLSWPFRQILYMFSLLCNYSCLAFCMLATLGKLRRIHIKMECQSTCLYYSNIIALNTLIACAAAWIGFCLFHYILLPIITWLGPGEWPHLLASAAVFVCSYVPMRRVVLLLSLLWIWINILRPEVNDWLFSHSWSNQQNNLTICAFNALNHFPTLVASCVCSYTFRNHRLQMCKKSCQQLGFEFPSRLQKMFWFSLVLNILPVLLCSTQQSSPLIFNICSDSIGRWILWIPDA